MKARRLCHAFPSSVECLLVLKISIQNLRIYKYFNTDHWESYKHHIYKADSKCTCKDLACVLD